MRIPIHRMLGKLVLLSALLTGGTLTVTASSAAADPTGCTTTNGGNFAESRCTSGTGEHRVVMRQLHFNPEVGEITCVGPWVRAGMVSRTACANEQVISVTAATRPNTSTPPSDRPMGVGGTMTEPDMIPVPVPPGTNAPMPVRCFSQLFQSLVVRTRDNAQAYTFFVDVTSCSNATGTFLTVPVVSAFFKESDPLLEEIVSIEVVLNQQTRLTPTAIALEARIEFLACLDPCQTYSHEFIGIANDRRGAAGSFRFLTQV